MRCTKAVIYKENLKYNLKQIRSHVRPETEICVAVKADGYGHNAVLTAQIAEKVGAAFVAVAARDCSIRPRCHDVRCSRRMPVACDNN